jgi:Holliday junction resolvasome RuvABC endonuclease subunit
MVPKLIKMTPEIAGKKRLDDEFDAIAVGLTHLACRHTKEHERKIALAAKTPK